MKLKELDEAKIDDICHSKSKCEYCPLRIRKGYQILYACSILRQTKLFKEVFGVDMLTEEALNAEIDIREEE